MSQQTDVLVERLVAGGYRATGPRRLVLEIIAIEGAHLSAQEILELARRRGSTLSRPTVYRTLDLLVGLNAIRPVRLADGIARYAVVADGHQHLVCTGCGLVTEFPATSLAGLDSEIEATFAFRPAGHLLEVYGECAQCR